MSEAFFDTDFPALARRFASVQASMVADVLDGMGRVTQTLPPDIRPLDRGMRIAGPAFTISGRASEGTHERVGLLHKALEILGSVPAHHVVIVESADGIGFSAHVGEFHATTMQARGAAGTVTQGGARDIEQVLDLGYPVFCRYNTCQDGLPRWEIVDSQCPITIGSVTIEPGDYVLGDTDGVVVIPASLRDQVLESAEAFAASENSILEEIKRGVHPLEALLAASDGPWGNN